MIDGSNIGARFNCFLSFLRCASIFNGKFQSRAQAEGF
jgi:hypothetical protein